MLSVRCADGLKKRDMAKAKQVKPRGVLHSSLDAAGFAHARYWPSPDLAAYVEHYWTVAWNLSAPCVRETLPHPVVHLVVELDEAIVGGPATRRWTREFAIGCGRVFAIKFRVGGFRPFSQGPVAKLADRMISVSDLFGAKARGLARDVLASDDHHASVAVLENFLRGCAPAADATVDLVAQIAERIAVDRDITRIEQVAAEFALTPRTLQRLFRDYVGVSPKWVIQRYRLHEVVERVDGAATPDWAAMAFDLGYADQAHLIRDFKRLVGRSPAEYARSLREKS